MTVQATDEISTLDAYEREVRQTESERRRTEERPVEKRARVAGLGVKLLEEEEVEGQQIGRQSFEGRRLTRRREERQAAVGWTRE